MVPFPTLYIPQLDWSFATSPKTPIAIISGKGKATDFKFGRYINMVHRPSEQKPIKNFGKSSRGRSQRLPKIFRAPMAHRAVIFVIAQLSCLFFISYFVDNKFSTVA